MEYGDCFLECILPLSIFTVPKTDLKSWFEAFFLALLCTLRMYNTCSEWQNIVMKICLKMTFVNCRSFHIRETSFLEPLNSVEMNLDNELV